MRNVRVLASCSVLLIALTAVSYSQQLPQCIDDIGSSWAVYQFSFNNERPHLSTPLLLTNGALMLQNSSASFRDLVPFQDWLTLSPDVHGCYGQVTVTGPTCSATLTRLASLKDVWSSPNYQYAPAAFSSAVLADGNVLIEGGELIYDVTGMHSCSTGTIPWYTGCPGVGGSCACESNEGALYNRITNTWTAVPAPTNLPNIGDGPATVLSNGTYLQGTQCSNQTALFNESTWSQSGPQENSGSEASYTLLPNGTVITVNNCNPTFQNNMCFEPTGGNNSEIYSPNPSGGTWNSAGSTPYQLYSAGEAYGCPDISTQFGGEQGPAILRPDGTYFATGGYIPPPVDSIYTSIYNTNPSSPGWEPSTSSPPFPPVNGMSVSDEDSGAVLLPDGNILLGTYYKHGSQGLPAPLIEFTKDNAYCQVTSVPTSPLMAPDQYEMLLLPTGQVLFVRISWAQGSNTYYIYTPNIPANMVYPGIAPTLNPFTNPVQTLHINTTYMVSGTQFNGASQANAFGDDFQNATNYPLVRITNQATGHVFFAVTHDHSTMGVATKNVPTYTHFEVLPNTELGLAYLQVVANGIASKSPGLPVNIQP